MLTPYVASFGLPGGMEVFWIGLVVLILFGSAALPKFFRSLGRSAREFKKARDGFYDEMEKEADKKDQEKAEDTDSSAEKSQRPTNGNA